MPGRAVQGYSHSPGLSHAGPGGAEDLPFLSSVLQPREVGGRSPFYRRGA